MFVELNPDTEKIIYSHFTCATGIFNYYICLYASACFSLCTFDCQKLNKLNFFLHACTWNGTVGDGTYRHWEYKACVLCCKGHYYANSFERVQSGITKKTSATQQACWCLGDTCF